MAWILHKSDRGVFNDEVSVLRKRKTSTGWGWDASCSVSEASSKHICHPAPKLTKNCLSSSKFQWKVRQNTCCATVCCRQSVHGAGSILAYADTDTFLNTVTENPSRNECLLSHHHNFRACLIWASKYNLTLSSKHMQHWWLKFNIVFFPCKCWAQWTLCKNH